MKPPFLSRPIHYVLALVFMGNIGPYLSAESCTVLSEAQKAALSTYVHSKYKIPQAVSVRVLQEELVADTCARKLTFDGRSAVRTWQLVLYLSSDLRFLTDKLYDTTLDPLKEQQLEAEKLSATFTRGTVPSLGSKDAAVTIVEFSDFQCPYCRRFEQIQKEVMSQRGHDVRFVYHYLPLSMHDWARPAALGAACAMLQSETAFWDLHDRLFDNQADTTGQNIHSKLLNYAATIKALDITVFKSCVDNEMSLGLVLRDINLAESNQISGTPTIFINGRRIDGVRTAAELMAFIDNAKTADNRAVAARSRSSVIPAAERGRQ